MTNITAPIMKFTDVQEAEQSYVEKLGFMVDWRWRHDASMPNPGYTSVSRDNIFLHLSSFDGDGAFGTAVYVYVADVDTLYDEFRQRGLDRFDQTPADQAHGTRDMSIRDPGYNQLRFGTLLSQG